MGDPVILETELEGLRPATRGKVRDIYEVNDDLLIVATDRISAFDSILPTGIPKKGMVLTALTLFWLDFLKDVAENHLITANVEEMGPEVQRHADVLRGRAMLVRKAAVFPVECVARGYLAGSGWKEYSQSGTICGITLPPGLKESDKLPAPIFTPATKAASGHDENISFERATEIVRSDVAERLRHGTLDLYQRASDYARERGIIISDTKFEWGEVDGKIILIDEVLTPDSSRFWPADVYASGKPQPSFDKQFVRDWLIESGWNKEPPAPELPDDVVRKTSEKYLQACEILTGKSLGD